MTLGRWSRRGLAALVSAITLSGVGYGGLRVAAGDAPGAAATGDARARMEHSPQWSGSTFGNRLERVDGPWLRMTTDWFTRHSEDSVPKDPVPTTARSGADYQVAPASGLRVTWLGHSTLLLEIDGARVLIDPVWGQRASPFSFMGPERWYQNPLPLAELPVVDAVLISHDHYDHLDVSTVRALRERGLRWVVPLGVGEHLASWGVPRDRIVELDWWEETSAGPLRLVATPARHFSGRWLTDQNATLWSGWAVQGPVHRVFYSGDTALHHEFRDIGERLGPFDLTMIEVGAYDALWADVHLGPEQAVLAHTLVRGQVMLPVHWGLFDLALHGWTEPMERVLVAAQAKGVRLVAPQPGGRVEPETDWRPAADVPRWWPEARWETVAQAPAWSTGVDDLLTAEGRP